MTAQWIRNMTRGILACLLVVLGVGVPALANVSRPVEGQGPTQVRIAIFVLDVDEINSAKQNFDANVYVEYRWRDPRAVGGGLDNVARSLQDVWHPRILFVNLQRNWRAFPQIVEVSPDGEVTYFQRAWATFSQPLNLEEFPFDRQVFTIQLASAGYTPDEVELLTDPDSPGGIAQDLSVADWDILAWKVESAPFVPVPGEEAVPGISFTFEAERKAGYFIVKVIIPLLLIVFMSWIVFWIDPKESGSQISVAITAMLTLIAYRFAVGSDLPKVSYLTRLDYFILGSTILVFASLIEVVVTSSYARTGRLERARAIDRWSSWLFPAIFILFSVQALLNPLGL